MPDSPLSRLPPGSRRPSPTPTYPCDGAFDMPPARPMLTVAAEGRVPLFDLHRQKARLGGELHRRLDVVLAHGQFILGPEVDELEQRLARYADVKHVIG